KRLQATDHSCCCASRLISSAKRVLPIPASPSNKTNDGRGGISHVTCIALLPEGGDAEIRCSVSNRQRRNISRSWSRPTRGRCCSRQICSAIAFTFLYYTKCTFISNLKHQNIYYVFLFRGKDSIFSRFLQLKVGLHYLVK